VASQKHCFLSAWNYYGKLKGATARLPRGMGKSVEYCSMGRKVIHNIDKNLECILVSDEWKPKC
jgi:hypothetical protein